MIRAKPRYLSLRLASCSMRTRSSSDANRLGLPAESARRRMRTIRSTADCYWLAFLRTMIASAADSYTAIESNGWLSSRTSVNHVCVRQP